MLEVLHEECLEKIIEELMKEFLIDLFVITQRGIPGRNENHWKNNLKTMQEHLKECWNEPLWIYVKVTAVGILQRSPGATIREIGGKVSRKICRGNTETVHGKTIRVLWKSLEVVEFRY